MRDWYGSEYLPEPPTEEQRAAIGHRLAAERALERGDTTRYQSHMKAADLLTPASPARYDPHKYEEEWKSWAAVGGDSANRGVATPRTSKNFR